MFRLRQPACPSRKAEPNINFDQCAPLDAVRDDVFTGCAMRSRSRLEVAANKRTAVQLTMGPRNDQLSSSSTNESIKDVAVLDTNIIVANKSSGFDIPVSISSGAQSMFAPWRAVASSFQGSVRRSSESNQRSFAMEGRRENGIETS